MQNSSISHRCVIILYDSIANSVCESQLITPIYAQNRNLHIISYEITTQHTLAQSLCTRYPGLKISILPRLPYICQAQLHYYAHQARQLIAHYPAYTLCARGPYAAYIAGKIRDTRCISYTAQCRGLIGAEYRYTHPQSYLHHLRAQQLEKFEHMAYAQCRADSIEVVSPALAHYLIIRSGIDPSRIRLATQDIPTRLSDHEHKKMRSTWRTQFKIPEKALVICYSGSAAPWQCLQATVAYCGAQIIKNPSVIALFLVPERDTPTIRALCATYQLPTDHVRIQSVLPSQVSSALCAADIGVLLREPHLLNWVSRPTKFLEYRAAHLSVIHNDTVAYLRTLPTIASHDEHAVQPNLFPEGPA